MRQAALTDLDPFAAVAHVGLLAAHGVRVVARLEPVPGPGQQHAEQHLDHLPQVRGRRRRGAAGHPPQVELVWGAGMQPVDAVAPVHQGGTHKEHIAAGLGGQRPQRGRDQGGGVAAQHPPGIDVPGVTRLPGDIGGVVAEQVVVVGDGDDPVTTAPAHLATPVGGERAGGAAGDELDRVRPFGRVGQVPDGQIAAEMVGS